MMTEMIPSNAYSARTVSVSPSLSLSPCLNIYRMRIDCLHIWWQSYHYWMEILNVASKNKNKRVGTQANVLWLRQSNRLFNMIKRWSIIDVRLYVRENRDTQNEAKINWSWPCYTKSWSLALSSIGLLLYRILREINRGKSGLQSITSHVNRICGIFSPSNLTLFANPLNWVDFQFSLA